MRRGIALRLNAIWLIAAIPLIIILSITYSQWYSSRLEFAKEQRRGYAQLSAQAFSLFVTEMQRTMRTSGVNAVAEMDPRVTDAELVALAELYPVSSIVYADESGIVRAASDPAVIGRNYSDHVAFQLVTRGGALGGIEPSMVASDGTVGFHISAVAQGKDLPGKGALLAFVDVSRLHDFFPVTVPGGGISVIDSEGKVVFQNENRAFAANSERWGDRYPFVRRAIEGEAATTDDFDFPSGQKRIGAFVPIRTIGWAAGSSVGADSVLSPIFEGVRGALPWILGIALVSLATSAAISTDMGRSLRRLVADARRIGNGELDQPVRVKDRRDEIGDVARSLDCARLDLGHYVEENAALFERQRRAADLNAALADIHTMLHASLAFRSVLDHVLERAAHALDCRTSGVRLLEDGELVGTARFGGADEIDPGADERSGLPTISSEVLETGAPVVIGDLNANERYAWIAERQDVRAVMMLPLLARQRIIGILHFTCAEPRIFTEEQMAFAAKLAYAVSLAWENARLYAEEHNVAETLQTALLALPDRVPGIEFAHAYRSATEAARVGGDFYDLFSLDNGLVGITIGDMAGHGVGAAALTSLVKNAIRVKAAETDLSPADVLLTANKLLYRFSDTETFATIFYGVLDPLNGTLRYSNAGHPAAAICGSDGVRLLAADSPLLGAFPDATFGESGGRLGASELLFMYTDGLTEARGDDGMYGEARLLGVLGESDCLDPMEAVRRVSADVLEYASNTLHDDLALLAVRRA